MKIGDLVEYLPGTVAIERFGVLLKKSVYGTNSVLVHWNEPDTANKKIQWWTPVEKLRLLEAPGEIEKNF